MLVISELIDSPIGFLTIVASNKGIQKILFGDYCSNYQSELNCSLALSHISLCKLQLQEYFSGLRTDFSIPLDYSGTAFQIKVWNALQTIPFGETYSYKEIAIKIGNDKACRAVGMANNKNPLPIIIPCHRIIGVSGKMVGYAGEIWRKEWLFDFETKNNKASQL